MASILFLPLLHDRKLHRQAKGTPHFDLCFSSETCHLLADTLGFAEVDFRDE